jgi:hypothetical protein
MMIKLFEGDTVNNAQGQNQTTPEGDLTPKTQTPDKPPVNQNLTLADGTNTDLATDSRTSVDAIDPYGQANIGFEKGNFSELSKVSQKIQEKLQTLNQTVIPLIMKALIELLGSNAVFHGSNFLGNISTDPEVQISAQIQYQCNLWIGIDISREDIMHDSMYILKTLEPVKQMGVAITKCAINVDTGTTDIGILI